MVRHTWADDEGLVISRNSCVALIIHSESPTTISAVADRGGSEQRNFPMNKTKSTARTLIAGLARWATTVTDRRRHARLVEAMKVMAREGLARVVHVNG